LEQIYKKKDAKRVRGNVRGSKLIWSFVKDGTHFAVKQAPM